MFRIFFLFKRITIPLQMAEKEIGRIESLPYDMKHIEWRILDFFSITEDEKYNRYFSPTFYVGDILFQLRLWTRGFCSSPDYIRIFLKPFVEREYSVEYYFGFRKRDGSVEQLVSGIQELDQLWGSQNNCLIKSTELLQRKSELVPCGILTITCTLKLMIEIGNSNQHTILEETKSLKFINLDKLSESFKGLFNDKESCDVTLTVKDKDYQAHRSVLMARSSVFAADFKHHKLEREINIPDCDPDSFQEFLEYLYCGRLEELSFTSAMNLYYTSNKFNVTELKAFCVEYLIHNLTVNNVCEAAVFADKYDDMQLFSAVQDFFNKHIFDILYTSAWECLMKNDFHLGNKLLKKMPRAERMELSNSL